MTGADESMITFVGERPGQVFRHTGDINKIKETLGWKPRSTWEGGLRETLKWYRENEDWWKKQLWLRMVPIVTKNGKKELH